VAASEKVDLEMRCISGKLNEHFAFLNANGAAPLYIRRFRPIRFWFCMKDHKYTWFLQFSWFWIS